MLGKLSLPKEAPKSLGENFKEKQRRAMSFPRGGLSQWKEIFSQESTWGGEIKQKEPTSLRGLHELAFELACFTRLAT